MSKKTSVYVVLLYANEYEDRRDEILKIFHNLQAAESFSAGCQEELKTYHAEENYSSLFHGHQIGWTGAYTWVAGPFEIE